ncbi:MAG: RNA polymerase sigma factor [Planctomycetota bacterium]|nr:RNA polymerase sigma factor [Planctomycetota bacterium]
MSARPPFPPAAPAACSKPPVAPPPSLLRDGRGRGAAFSGGDEPSLGALVRCARDGDPLAFRSVAERLGPELVRFVMRFTSQPKDFANDVVQDAFVAAWCNLDGIRDDNHIRPWLYRVARFKAVDRLRKRGPGGVPMTSLDMGRTIEVEPEAAPASDPADGVHTSREAVRHAMSRALAALPVRYAGAVRLHYLHGMPVGETARLLGLPKPTVKMRLFRARRRLRQLLHGEIRRVHPPVPEADRDERGGASHGPIET